ncbi:MAG: phosphoribosyltransferase [Flavobacteriales bacterium]|jgi:predicted phosphoribosyltransferase
MERAGFVDRAEAGVLLAQALEHYRGTDALILAIPRGGVVVGHAMATALDLPLDIVLAKKIGHPANPELAIGAVSLDSQLVDPRYDVSRTYLDTEVKRIRSRSQEKALMYRGERPPPGVKDRPVIVVDDGVATGNTLLATLELLRRQHPSKLVVAMPVVPPRFIRKGRILADELIHLLAPPHFQGVGQFYDNFQPVEDEGVVRLLNDAWKSAGR